MIQMIIRSSNFKRIKQRNCTINIYDGRFHHWYQTYHCFLNQQQQLHCTALLQTTFVSAPVSISISFHAGSKIICTTNHLKQQQKQQQEQRQLQQQQQQQQPQTRQFSNNNNHNDSSITNQITDNNQTNNIQNDANNNTTYTSPSNFSTSRNNNNKTVQQQEQEQEKRRLNNQIAKTSGYNELLSLLEIYIQYPASNGYMNCVNFSTILHRFVKIQQKQQNQQQNQSKQQNQQQNQQHKNRTKQVQQQGQQQGQGQQQPLIDLLSLSNNDQRVHIFFACLAEALVSETLLIKVPKHPSNSTISATLIPTTTTTGSTNTTEDRQNTTSILEILCGKTKLQREKETTTKTLNAVQPINDIIHFDVRSISSIVWSITKLNCFNNNNNPSTTIVTPISEMQHHQQQQQEQINVTVQQLQVCANTLLQTITSIRQRQQHEEQQQVMVDTSQKQQTLLLLLGTQILDYISLLILYDNRRNQHHPKATTPAAAATATTTETTTTIMEQQQQKLCRHWKQYNTNCCSLLLWSYGTNGRYDTNVFEILGKHLLHHSKLSNQYLPFDVLSLREWSISLLSFAKTGVTIHDIDIRLMKQLVSLLDVTYRSNSDYLLSQLTSQQCNNIVWAVVTMCHRRLNDISMSIKNNNIINQQYCKSIATGIARHIAQTIIARTDFNYANQELHNIAWSFAKIEYGHKRTSSETNENNTYITTSTTGIHTKVLDQKNQYYTTKNDRDLMHNALDIIITKALPNLYSFDTHALWNILWAVSKLVDTTDPLMPDTRRKMICQLSDKVALELLNTNRDVQLDEICISIWSMVNLRMYNLSAIHGLAKRFNTESHNHDHYHPTNKNQCRPKDLHNLVWALATIHNELSIPNKDAFDTTFVIDSNHRNHLFEKKKKARTKSDTEIVGCFGFAADLLIQQPHQFKLFEIRSILWGFAHTGVRHPILFKSSVARLVELCNGPALPVDGTSSVQHEQRIINTASLECLATCAWAYARHAQLGQVVSQQHKKYPDDKNLVSLQCDGAVAIVLTSYLDVGEQRMQQLFRSIADSYVFNSNNLRNCEPIALAKICWSFGIFGFYHQPFSELIMNELVHRTQRYMNGEINSITSIEGQVIANIVWSCSTLNMDIGNALRKIEPYIRERCTDKVSGEITKASIAEFFSDHSLSNLAWACSVSKVFPIHIMKIIYIGLIDTPTNHLSHSNCQLSNQIVTTLFTTQIAMDLDSCTNELYLPNNFTDFASKEDKTTESTSLHTSTSSNPTRLHQIVSESFNRIGFHHTLEYSITAKDIVDNYSIRIPATNHIVFAIDIANVPEKIAIEIDGPGHYVTRINESHHTPVQDAEIFVQSLNGALDFYVQWNGKQQSMNGSTSLKHRLLKSMGWTVITIPFWEWDNLRRDVVKEDQYCQELLDSTKCSNSV